MNTCVYIYIYHVYIYISCVYIYIMCIYIYYVYMYTPSGDSTSSWGNRHGFALRRPHTSPAVWVATLRSPGSSWSEDHQKKSPWDNEIYLMW